MYMSILTHVCMCHLYVLGHQRHEEGIPPWNWREVKDGYKLPRSSWVSNLGPL